MAEDRKENINNGLKEVGKSFLTLANLILVLLGFTSLRKNTILV